MQARSTLISKEVFTENRVWWRRGSWCRRRLRLPAIAAITKVRYVILRSPFFLPLFDARLNKRYEGLHLAFQKGFRWIITSHQVERKREIETRGKHWKCRFDLWLTSLCANSLRLLIAWLPNVDIYILYMYARTKR
jgi:hypothetical protein